MSNEVMCTACSGSGIGPSGDTASTCYECNGTGAARDSELEREITSIFITIDNYGTNSEARIDIEKLIKQQVVTELKALPHSGFINADGIRFDVVNVSAVDERIKELEK